MRDVSFRSSYDLSKSIHELLLKAIARKRGRVLANRLTIPRSSVRRFESADQRIYHGLVEEDAGAILDDRVERTTRAEGDHRRADSHRFHGRDAEVLDARQDERPSARQMVEDHLSR